MFSRSVAFLTTCIYARIICLYCLYDSFQLLAGILVCSIRVGSIKFSQLLNLVTIVTRSRNSQIMTIVPRHVQVKLRRTCVTIVTRKPNSPILITAARLVPP